MIPNHYAEVNEMHFFFLLALFCYFSALKALVFLGRMMCSILVELAQEESLAVSLVVDRLTWLLSKLQLYVIRGFISWEKMHLLPLGVSPQQRGTVNVLLPLSGSWLAKQLLKSEPAGRVCSSFQALVNGAVVIGTWLQPGQGTDCSSKGLSPSIRCCSCLLVPLSKRLENIVVTAMGSVSEEGMLIRGVQ